MLLLSKGEAVAGGAMMRTGDRLAPQGAVEFKRIWTHPNYRGRGALQVPAAGTRTEGGSRRLPAHLPDHRPRSAHRRQTL